MPKHRSLPLRGIVVAACALTGLLACTESQSSNLTEPSILAAKPSGAKAPKVRVTEAIPGEAPQETTLTVEILGSGFDDGSVVRFLGPDGSTTGMAVVTSPVMTPDETLIAELTIAADADVALYDIEVTTSRGKKGIGSEKFSVKLKGAPTDLPVSATFRGVTGDLSGDGVLSDGGGTYEEAVILVIGNLMLDARRDIPRQLCFDFAGQPGAPFGGAFCDDGYLTTADLDLEGGLPAMAVDVDGTITVTTRGQVTWVKQDAAGKGYNWFLRFGMDCESADVVADRLTVSHPDESTWTLEGTHAVLCKMPTKGRPVAAAAGEFSMPFALTLVK